MNMQEGLLLICLWSKNKPKNPLHQHSEAHLHKTQFKFIEMKTEKVGKKSIVKFKVEKQIERRRYKRQTTHTHSTT